MELKEYIENAKLRCHFTVAFLREKVSNNRAIIKKYNTKTLLESARDVV